MHFSREARRAMCTHFVAMPFHFIHKLAIFKQIWAGVVFCYNAILSRFYWYIKLHEGNYFCLFLSLSQIANYVKASYHSKINGSVK